ncbi:C4-dicarboxylate ABC transporter substrate-binding protein [Marivita geojedonensis]|uniref:TRAP transporter small permease protein n=2 Tax=Marivita geojedonensis TaxID=1123756 RepID=A0A1X4NPL0_9RHOB|nr:C4-dicarboxylate ABC transporter substrate-binding protein [Marivita geojedonensis]PRY80862.1 TRAP-type C4-dicarboxylate transport system permease small subunit [Marivita geojedonensis]
MGLFSRLRDFALSALAVIGAIAIVALMLHIISDVALRNTLNQPVPATYEIVTNYYMVALAFIPLAWLERSGGMVRVEVIDGFLGPRSYWLSEKLVALISTAIYGMLAWVTFEASLKTFAAGTFVLAQNIPIPTWPAYFLPPLGFFLAAVVTALRLVERQTTHEPL